MESCNGISCNVEPFSKVLPFSHNCGLLLFNTTLLCHTKHMLISSTKKTSMDLFWSGGKRWATREDLGSCPEKGPEAGGGQHGVRG